MTLEQFLNLLTQIIFLIVAASTVINWVKDKDQSRRDIALVFISLAIAFIAQDTQNLLKSKSIVFTIIFFVAVVTQPYLLLRVTRYFHMVSTGIQRAALFGLLLTYASLVLAQTAPTIVVVIFIAYFIIVEGYVSYVLVQGALTIPGMTGKRLQLVSLGSGLLTLGFLIVFVFGLIGLTIKLPSTVQSILGSLTQILAILSGLSYYFGFAPPRWLKRSWQLNELHEFLSRTSGQNITNDHIPALEQLASASTRTAGGTTAIIARWNPTNEKLEVEKPGEPPFQTKTLDVASSELGRVWNEQKARAIQIPDLNDQDMPKWMKQIEARTLFVVPIKSSVRLWGLLIVALQYTPLFAEDDLDLLTLLSEQSAIQLDYAALIKELQELNESLKGRVVERATQLEQANHELETEISIRKQTEKVLRESEERFRVLIDAAPSAMIVVNREGEIALTNVRAQKLFGYPKDELSGKPIEMLIPLQFRHGHIHDRQKYFAQPVSRPMGAGRDLFGLHKDGHEIPVEIGLTPYESAEGPFTLAQIVDITERKQAIEVLRRAQDELEDLVQKRTKALSQANASLEIANKELESFSYSVSHDLRTPLRSIDGFSLALLEDFGSLLPAEGQDYLQRVRTAAQHMAELIDDLLNLSRVTRATVEPISVNLSTIADNIMQDLRRQQPQREATISIAPDLIVHGDSRLLKIALENLLNNAWKFTSKQTTTMIEFNEMKQNGQRVFFIRDNGVGFDMTYANKLFGAFQRLHSTQDFPGTGVGLATVQRIFLKHGGRIWAESDVGQGATFYFTL